MRLFKTIKKSKPSFILLTILLFLLAAFKDPQLFLVNKKLQATSATAKDRFVFRLSLDGQPRIIVAALDSNMWVAYDAQYASLYKAWKGGINFDGAVYNSRHFVQPNSLGYGFYEEPLTQAPWKILLNKKLLTPAVQYKGYVLMDNYSTVTFLYELTTPGNNPITVAETPKYLFKNGQYGLVRKFVTGNVPDGASVVLNTVIFNVVSIADFSTDGTFTQTSVKQNVYGIASTKTYYGNLILQSNNETTLQVLFANGIQQKDTITLTGKKPNTISDFAKGKLLITKNDCNTCHNIKTKMIGPAFFAVSKKYAFTDANIDLLASRIIKGSKGNWGTTAMTPHPTLSSSNARLIVSYILSITNKTKKPVVIVDMAKELNLKTATTFITDISDHTPAPDTSDPFYNNGLAVNVYLFNKEIPQNINEIKKAIPSKPNYSGTVANVHFISDSAFGSNFKDYFYLQAKGYLQINKKGLYIFRTVSDDGSLLYIDGKLVVDNNGAHGLVVKKGSLLLNKGMHTIELQYANNGGDKALSLQWKPATAAAFSVIPASLFSHREKQIQASITYVPVVDKVMPGDQTKVAGVHPSFTLSQARPDSFKYRIGGIDFLPDGRLVVCTWDSIGGVYIIDKAQSGDPSKMSFKRIAAGLAEPLGLKVVDGEIYVMQKHELTKLVDNDGDGIIDEYRCVSNAFEVTGNFHAFAFGLLYNNGYFYATLATDIPPTTKMPRPRGTMMKISKADGSIEYISSGFRTPNGVGFGYKNEMFVTDNQGNWLPASKMVHIRPGAFFGFRFADSARTNTLHEDPPVVWLPQDEIANSPSTPIPLNYGPYKGQMAIGEVTQGGLNRVFVEEIKEQLQGAAFRFTQGLETGVNRVIVGPDSAIYIGGVGAGGNWGDDGKLWYGLQKLTYNNKSTFEMLAMRAKHNGFEIEFTEPLDVKIGNVPADYFLQQWMYKPTKDYGGPKIDLKQLTVQKVTVSQDRRKVFLAIDGLQQNHVVYLRLLNDFTNQNAQHIWSTEAWYTLNNIPE